MKKTLSFLLALWVFLAGCNAPLWDLRARDRTPTAPPAAKAVDPSAAPVGMVAVTMYVQDAAIPAPDVWTGTEVVIVLRSEPSWVTTQKDAVIWKPWEDHPVAQMRACFSPDSLCMPEGDWQPFTPTLEYPVPVDWLGPRDLHAAVEFRDGAGKRIPAGDPSSGRPQETYAAVLTITSRANPDQPVETLPPAAQTAQAATRAAFPVTGSVEIEAGRCCAGGKADTSIDLKVEFQATSPAGAVTEMRVQTGGGCRRSDAALEADWEPYAPEKTLQTRLATNWVGFYVNVQYRDAQGNLSPVYCDDISLEGSP